MDHGGVDRLEYLARKERLGGELARTQRPGTILHLAGIHGRGSGARDVLACGEIGQRDHGTKTLLGPEKSQAHLVLRMGYFWGLVISAQ